MSDGPLTDDDMVAAAIAGGESAFAALTQRYRRELHVHCYRMLGSFEEAEDVLQETFLRAWTKRDTFDPGTRFRAWLYRIATNACLDVLRQRNRRPAELRSFAEMPWLQPYPDRLLDEIAPRSQEPDAVVVRRETIELAFVAAIQLLPARQRAVLIMRDVVGWSAAESAEILNTTVAVINSALQRARATLREKRPAGRRSTSADLSRQERDLLQRYLAVHDRPDPVSMAALARHDIRVTMPPQPLCFDGWESLAPLHKLAFGPEGFGDWQLVPTGANRMPAAACYLRERGDTVFRAHKLDVIRVEDGLIAEITSFEPHLFPAFGLAATL